LGVADTARLGTCPAGTGQTQACPFFPDFCVSGMNNDGLNPIDAPTSASPMPVLRVPFNNRADGF